MYLPRKINRSAANAHIAFQNPPDADRPGGGLGTALLLLSGLVFAAALAATLFAAYSISRSLARLTRAAERFQRFDFAKPLKTRSRISEVRELVGSFRSLQDTLRRYRHLLDLISRERDLTSLQPAIVPDWRRLRDFWCPSSTPMSRVWSIPPSRFSHTRSVWVKKFRRRVALL